MLVLTTDKAVRRFCSRCKASMVVSKQSDGIFAAHCPQADNEPGRHDSVLQYSNYEALRKYALELFAPKEKKS
jgi:hypothetical protein